MADFKHFFLDGTRSEVPYTSAASGGEKKNGPARPERKTHAAQLLTFLERAEKKARARQKKDPTRDGIQFIPMRFDEGSEIDLELKRLESESTGIKVLSAKEKSGRKEYVVAVPDSQVKTLAAKFKAYRDDDTITGKPQNEPLASSISKIDSAELEDYLTDA